MDTSRVKAIAAAAKKGDLGEAGNQFIELILDTGINGAGPFKSADAIAQEASIHASGDIDAAIKRVIKTHMRVVGVSGFATGLGGLGALPIAIPTDVTVFYAQGARMVAAIATLRGYDPASDDVRSAVAVSLVGAFGTEAVAKIGAEVAGKAGVAALKKLPGKVLIEINKKVGFRLITKFGEKGVINLVKVIPVASSAIGAGINVAGIRTIAGYAKRNFPALPPSEEE